jgi:hypothetical protein
MNGQGSVGEVEEELGIVSENGEKVMVKNSI